MAEGRRPVFRLRMPDHDISWNDLVRGEITFTAGTVPDFVLARGNGTRSTRWSTRSTTR